MIFNFYHRGFMFGVKDIRTMGKTGYIEISTINNEGILTYRLESFTNRDYCFYPMDLMKRMANDMIESLEL
jgi:hypothetical protein